MMTVKKTEVKQVKEIKKETTKEIPTKETTKEELLSAVANK